MAAGRIVISEYTPARDRNDQLVAGAKMFVYTNRTTTLATIYTTAALTTPLANPVVANASGQWAEVWADDALLFTVSITGPDGESIGNPSVFDDYSPSTNFAITDVLEYKAPVRVASTANITIASALINGSTIDGVTVATGDRVLLKDQSTGSQNGIYVVVASGAASRSGDADTSAKVLSGTTMFVSEGTANGGGVFTLTTPNPIVLGTTALTFSRYAGIGVLPVANGGTGSSTASGARTNLAVVGTAELAASGGSALVGFLQSGADAASETVQTNLRRIVVCPEQFSGTDQQKVYAALQSAGDVPGGQLVARIVRLSRFYDTTATLDVPAYVTIEGTSQGRAGLRPTMSSGPALRVSTLAGSSNFLTEWRDFTIDGVNATGSAHALEITGEKNSMLSRITFSNFDTTSHAVRLLLGCQSIVFDQCRWLNNRLHQRIGVPYVGTSYPTTVTHRSCIYENGLITGAEAVIVEDSSSCMWDQKCVLQGNLQPVLFRVTSSANEQSIAEHQWLSPWIEGNGAGPTWSFEGNAAKPLTNCVIEGAAIHGTVPSALVYAINTDRLQTQNNFIPAGYTLLSDGGGNTRYNQTSAFLYQLNTATFADVDGTNHRVWAPDGDVVFYAGATENLHTNTTHRFASIGAASDFAIINSAGVRSNASFLLAANKLADVDGTNHRIFAPDGDITAYFGATENLFPNTTHRFSSIGVAADFAIINSTGIRSNGTFLIGANTVLDIDGTNHRLFAPDGDPVFYAGATENLHRNATHRFSNQAVSVDYGIFSSVGLNLGAGLALQIGGTQVVGARGAAVADATDAASAITQLNALLARCRAHGLIAT